jgi:di/tricarboxylate transporter
MTNDQITLFALFGVIFVLLIWGRWRYDIVAFAALMVAVILGLVPAKEAFHGFGHPATLVVALVLVVSAGLTRAGAVMLITRTLIDAGRSLGAHVAIMGAVGGILSAFMNNVAALALLMPVDVASARKAGRAPGLSLMPLSFATILGGMVTLIGTPPNIIIATIRQDKLGTSFAMFDFAPVGGVVALAGLAFVALVGWRLIPQPEAAAAAPEAAAYVAELKVPKGARLIGRKLTEVNDDADKTGVALMALLRAGERHYGRAATTEIDEGDILLLEAEAAALDEFRASQSLDFASSGVTEYTPAEKAGLVPLEVVVPAGARIAGKSAEAVGLIWRHRSVLVGISRQGQRVKGPLRKAPVEPGDILLLLAPADTADEMVAWLGCLPLADRGLAVTQDRSTWAAIGIFAAAVIAASLGWIDLPVALGCVVIGYVAARILPLTELYDQIEWPVIVLLGSMIPLGGALESSGATDLIAGAIVAVTSGAPAWVALLVLMVVTMSLSDVLNNTATAIVAAPVGIGMAHAMEVSPDPFLMAVAVAASCAFLTPIGHKNNMLILGPGGYRFGDYWRMGLPLEVLVIAVGLPMILIVWPL